MSTKSAPTIEDLYRVDGKAELVNGEIVPMSPTGGLPNYAAREIMFSLREYEKQTRNGHAVGDNAAFKVQLPNRGSFSPEAAYYLGEITMRFFEGAPVFAAEVRSEGDYGPGAEMEMARKRADYFSAGTLVVWDVDLLSDEVVKVYRHDEPLIAEICRRGEAAEAEAALPGWTMPVDDLFPQP
jgi:Uma2 family endonuclease